MKRKLKDVITLPSSSSDDCKSSSMSSFKKRKTAFGDVSGDTTTRLERPNTALNTDEDVLFQIVDTDSYVGYSPATCGSRSLRESKPVIRLYGVRKDGSSLCAHVVGFCPYFYIKVWEGFRSGVDAEAFRAQLETALRNDQKKHSCHEYVPKVAEVRRQSIWGYQFGEDSVFLKVFVTLPVFVSASRRLLRGGLFLNGNRQQMQTYESSMPFELRFMIDTDIVGMGWVQLPKDKGVIHVPDFQKTSHCTHELVVKWGDIEAQQLDEIAPLRILSFDIECLCSEGFPEATRKGDAVIQISAVVKVQGTAKYLNQTMFCLDSCAPIAGCTVRSFETEASLLKAFVKYWIATDPDLVTGYNIINFDLPYLLDRAEFLKVSADFAFLGRIKNSRTTMKDTSFSSKAYGSSNSKDIRIDGRVQLDLLPLIRRQHKLRSYSLNSVSFHFLKQQKEDVHYSIIGDLQNGDEQSRRRLAVYCLKDAVLPLRLIDSLMVVINQIEMARVTGVPMSYLLTRGQQIKVLSQLYRKAKRKGIVIPQRDRSQNDNDTTYEGAVVIAPICGFYDTPITTLDFASLYPSIMMAHNLCYTTMLAHSDLSRLSPDDYTKTPTGNYFVKAKNQKGLLCEILDELLTARSKAKKDMKNAKDAFSKSVLNGRQLALKISANSVYGFTGATVGSLPCLAISASVTGFGRQMINDTKNFVEEKYCVAEGYEVDAKVIYGDTDSVMIKFGVSDMAESMRLGAEAAERVSAIFISPIRLEFEKVYLPYLLMNKKRYAGMLWTKPAAFDYMDAKGIETVRRDNCELVKLLVQKVLDCILIERDVGRAEVCAKQVISNLLQNRVDLSMLVISKALGKIEDYKAKMAHVELAKRMQKRDAATAPKAGDRVAYVVIKGAKGAKTYEKAEDPLYVLENDVPLDTEYYLKNQLKMPLSRIFAPILGDKINTLFSGKHTRAIKLTTSKAGALSRFTVVKKTCLGCRVPLKRGQTSVCDHCKAKEAQLYMERMATVRRHEMRFSAMWTQCQRCQGSLTQKVICSNSDCPIFYRRTKAKKDLDEARKTLQQFNI